MVYEIFFEPNGAVWRIRITVFYLYFIAVTKVVRARKDTPVCEFMDFPTFDEADRFARRVGLDKAYQRRERNGLYVTQVQGALAHGTHS